jgi:poly-gamma-glutamate synthesis protein (capsule biosynthesis protein)
VLALLVGCTAPGAAAPGPAVPVPPAAGSPAAGSPAPAAPAPRTFSLVATGDVLLHPPLWRQAAGDGGGPMDFTAQLAGIRPAVSEADLALCHLETPLAPAGGPYRGYPAFSAPPQVVAALAATGFDACSTASNHSFDQGAAGIDRTLDALDRAGIAHAGTARSPAEAAAVRVLEVPTTAGPVRVGLLSYTFGTNGVAAPGGQTWRGNLIDEARILRDAATARRQGAEVTVVALHWGEEYVPAPNAQQRALAPRLLASPDIDLLLGHHSHVAQPIRQIAGKWVAYGLGNLLAAHATPGDPLREGLLARFVVTLHPGGRTTTEAGYAPLLVTSTAPLRVLDVAATLRAGGAPGASPARLAQAWERTTRVVEGEGAAAAGLRPLLTP